MRSKIEEFLLDKYAVSMIYEDQFTTNYKIQKEEYDNRFIILYLRRENEGLKKENYNVCGYYDTQEHVLYNADYNISKYFGEKSKIKLSSFNTLEEEIINGVNKKINEYLVNNQEKLAKEGKNKHLLLNNHDIKNNIQSVARKYITEANPKIELYIEFTSYDIINNFNIRDANEYINYLNNKDGYIEKIANSMIKNKKEDLGLTVLLYRDKLKYLDEIIKNKNGIYNQAHLNRNIYNSLRDVYAKQVTITLKYGDKTLDFKFDYDRLKVSLANCEAATCDYKSSYNIVSNFIKNNDINKSSNKWKEDFEFSHIEYITYGKNRIYDKNDFKIEKVKNKDMER